MSRFVSSFSSRILPWLVIVHTLAFLFFWQTNKLFYASTNDYLADLLGQRVNYVRLLIWVSALIGAWSCVCLVLTHFGKTHGFAVLFSWLYGLISFIYITFFYASFGLLFRQAPVQLLRIGQLIAYFRVFPDAALILGAGSFASFWLKSFIQKNTMEGGGQNWIPAILVLFVLIILWVLPLIFPPASVIRGPLPEKPQIFAHRGASMLAPENTLVAAQLAVDMKVYGLETDIQISRDGGLFLLHDESFGRTTDIQSVYPGREAEPAGNFTLAEITRLNAGKWFLEQDPFYTVSGGLLTQEQEQVYQQQTVPLLSDWLNLLRQSKQAFIFDLKGPPKDHPYADSFFDISFNQIHQAGIDPQIWFLVDERQLQTLRRFAPDMKPAFGADYQSLPAVEELKVQGYQMVNVEYGISPQRIKQYQDGGLWVNLYTVDEPWQFSRLWLIGVDSITTSNAHVMVAIHRPILGLPYNLYVLLWILVGLFDLGLVAVLIYPVVSLAR